MKNSLRLGPPSNFRSCQCVCSLTQWRKTVQSKRETNISQGETESWRELPSSACVIGHKCVWSLFTPGDGRSSFLSVTGDIFAIKSHFCLSHFNLVAFTDSHIGNQIAHQIVCQTSWCISVKYIVLCTVYTQQVSTFGLQRMIRKKRKRNEHGLNIYNVHGTELTILQTLPNTSEVSPVQD